ncbi:uncharacterized protein LOC122577880 isoform X2 [Bombus pyrosoma]|uniref:uncharacterized protein LOC122577880 isoform X2 n=1 Tax=Bombus pyrosoma TaxID=396416 RepID=UPI001CB9A205|nr:uncharacterized protein LOC122577880 isoform X2 [Bombus pyrosoma]
MMENDSGDPDMMENDSGERTGIEKTDVKKEVRATNTVKSTFRVSIPPFWPKNIELWYAVLENEFKLARITDDDSKFSLIVANIQLEYLEQIPYISGELPAAERYERLKRELIKKFSESESTRMQKFVSDKKIGDRKPSQFYWDLRKVAPVSISDDLVLATWKIRLPEHIQYALIVVNIDEVKTAMKLADKIYNIPCHEERKLRNKRRNATKSKQQTRVLSIEDRLSQIEERMNALSLNNRCQAKRCCPHCNWNQSEWDGSVCNCRSPVTDKSERISSHVNTGANLCANQPKEQCADSIEHKQQHEDRAEIQNDQNGGQSITEEKNARNQNVARANKQLGFFVRVLLKILSLFI